ncbi:P-loop NTPase family protein [Allokutzneria albata]|uniref:MinD-like ATPase involved in chromosome partitioning or flagellar assembly n=1 Tax=Allokutzneria albata TaxID=211114 RepID=A0A1G9YA89_ALLAB|nr:hypothetical protein [Allokutzneria albata]SDN05967.1 hypothetical protein SAMN04489726_4693 [Allokutzneria albata]
MLLAIASVKGSPGVTTTALAFAVCWPTRDGAVVVEADPAGGDLAARCGLGEPGLVSLAAHARSHSDPGYGSLLLTHTRALPSGILAVVGPVGARQARAALSVLAAQPMLLRHAAGPGGPAVIVDCGRLDAESVVLPLVRVADAVVLVARAQDADLAHALDALPMIAGLTPQPAFVLAGPGHSEAEVAAALGIAVMGRLPWDARGAAALYRPSRAHQAPSRSALGHAAARLANLLYRHHQHRLRTTTATGPLHAPLQGACGDVELAFGLRS